MDAAIAVLVASALPWAFLTFVVAARQSTAVFGAEKE
jgi:hypothetical protein